MSKKPVDSPKAATPVTPATPVGPRGTRKAAIMLITLDPDTSGKIFQALPEEDMERLSQEIAGLGLVEKDEMLDVLEEFKDIAMVQQMLREGGYDSAIELIRNSLPPEKADRLIRLLEAQRQSMPFHFLEHTEADVMVTFLQEEHPQTIALVLSYMPPQQAADEMNQLLANTLADAIAAKCDEIPPVG